jgi:uracil phosphoribosyltransferase
LAEESGVPSYPEGFTLIQNNLATHKLSLLRDRASDSQRCRRLFRQLGFLLCAAATEDLPFTLERNIITPADASINVPLLEQHKFLILVLLRAGLVLAEGFQELLPFAPVGHFGFVPAEAGEAPEPYLATIPGGTFRTIFLVASAITTGQSVIAAVNMLTELEVPPEYIRIATILASRRGLEALYANPAHAGIKTFAVACDEALTKTGQVSPGMGKAGNRVFGTAGVYE